MCSSFTRLLFGRDLDCDGCVRRGLGLLMEEKERLGDCTDNGAVLGILRHGMGPRCYVNARERWVVCSCCIDSCSA
jgi:hypothetical protein